MRPRARRMYDRFERLIARCGEYHVSPAKTSRVSGPGTLRGHHPVVGAANGLQLCPAVSAALAPLRAGRGGRARVVDPPDGGHGAATAGQASAGLAATKLPAHGAAGASEGWGQTPGSWSLIDARSGSAAAAATEHLSTF